MVDRFDSLPETTTASLLPLKIPMVGVDEFHILVAISAYFFSGAISMGCQESSISTQR